MSTNTLKENIFVHINNKPASTFVELSENINGFNGNSVIGSDSRNTIFWAGISIHAVTAINELIKEGKIVMSYGNIFTYLIDGEVLNHPLTEFNPKVEKDYAQMHWQPVVFDAVGGSHG